MHRGVGGERGHRRLDVGLSGILGELDSLRDEPGLLGLLVLHAHVDLTRLVGADQHGGEAHARRSGGVDLGADPRDGLVAQAVAVHQYRPTGRVLEVAHQDSPTISPFSSKSMRAAAGFLPSPGIVRISPQIG